MLVDTLMLTALRVADAHGGRLPHHAWFFLDEFASALGRLRDFEVRLNTFRSRRIGVVAAVQGLAQLRLVYGDGIGALLTGFSSKLFFPGLEVEDAEYASRLAGTTTIDVDTVQVDASGHRVVQTTPVSRPLLLAEDIARPVAHPVLGRPVTALLADLPPTLLYLTPAFEQRGLGRALAAAAKAPPVRRAQPLVFVPRRVANGSSLLRLRQAAAGQAAAIGYAAASSQARTWWDRHALDAQVRIGNELVRR
jgi:hypothetical protein